MDFLDQIPALAKVGLAFTLIMVLNRARLHLSVALLIGAGVLGLMLRMAPLDVLMVMVRSLIDPGAISLIFIITVILTLSRILMESGQLERMVASFTRMVSDARITAMVMPILIGLLPMPGGALFSAPMVESACRGNGASPELKTAVNHWFRHIWEHWWPLYPGVVLAVGLLKVEFWKFTLIQLPLSFFEIIGGLIFLIPALPKPSKSADPECAVSPGGWADFRREVRPITLVVLALPAVWLFEKTTGIGLPQLTAVYIGLGLCLTMVLVQNHTPLAMTLKYTFNRTSLLLILLIMGIMAFKGVLIESRAVNLIQAEMVRFGIPALVIIILMPLLSGFITGVTIGFVGASFPLIVPLLAGREGLDFLGYSTLAFAFGHIGMMLSPVHVCLVVTKDYFAAGMTKSYWYMAGPTAVFLAGAFILFGLTRLAG